jgi:hypothetical protein
MKNSLILIAIAACTIMTACESEERSQIRTGSTEMTVASRQRQNDIAPILPVRTREGKLVELSEAAEPIMVLAFVDSKGDCDYVDGRLRDLASSLSLEGITVVQISEGCEDCGQLVEQINIDRENFMVLCDGKQIAHEAFRGPSSGSVYVINQNDRIVYESNMNDLGRVQREAKRANKEYEEYLYDVLRNDFN